MSKKHKNRHDSLTVSALSALDKQAAAVDAKYIRAARKRLLTARSELCAAIQQVDNVLDVIQHVLRGEEG